MKFLTLRSKPILTVEEMLPKWFYSERELRKIRNLEYFGGWTSLGFYVSSRVNVVKDWPSEYTCNTPNWSIEDYTNGHDYFCNWLLDPEDMVIL